MLENLIKKIIGDPDVKKVKYYSTLVAKINDKQKEFENLNLDQVKAKTAEFKSMFEWLDFEKPEDSKKIISILDDIKLDAFALVKQACNLINGQTFTLSEGKTVTWNMIPYDVQLIGWMAIHEGHISEMKTWEWKTLVATLPAYLNALTGNTVTIVTVNDYLAKRDSEEMGILYKALGLTVWVITHDQAKFEKKEAYNCDIVYATNNEMWFDYLRDNMVTKIEDKSQARLFFAIIDEVDSILIDEARTPLIISAADSEPTTKYIKFAALARDMKSWVDYKVDEKQKTATLTEAWVERLEKYLWVENIYMSEHYNDIHHIENAIKAVSVYLKDVDYLVANDEVHIIDEHTWRVLAWRRYSEWLHQAIEAKEKVEIKQESKTLASITFQNYFRMFWKLAWMTGTAKTEEEEFYKVYGLQTLVIPTNKPIARVDKPDLLFKNEMGKFEYTINLIKELHKSGQPILIGTISVAKSEYLSSRLVEAWIPHTVLNAKQHEKEAEIVAAAGQKWAVTIATNMAWRWTDIKLWEWVVELGWLIILGTEKHETRRIDNQLRWRAWRQWDAGMTQFLVSPQDEIMRIFGWDKLFGIFNTPMFASIPDNEPLTDSKMLTSRIVGVQKQVEWHHFDSRKHVLEYDDVMNKHREIIYRKRNKILASENIDEDVTQMLVNQVSRFTHAQLANQNKSDYDLQKLVTDINIFLDYEVLTYSDSLESYLNSVDVVNKITKMIRDSFVNFKSQFPDSERFFEIERMIVLQSIDNLWMAHIDNMSKLRDSVAFAWYAQKNPLVEYKEKAFEKFEELIDEIEFKTTKALFSIRQETVIENTWVDDSSLELNDAQIEALLNNYNEVQKQNKENANPLFANPTKIRV